MRSEKFIEVFRELVAAIWRKIPASKSFSNRFLRYLNQRDANLSFQRYYFSNVASLRIGDLQICLHLSFL